MIPYGPNCHYISSSAKLPEAFPSGTVYKFADVGVVVDFNSMTIVDASITLVTRAARLFLRSKLIGQQLTEKGVEAIEMELNRTYHGTAHKAIIVAIRQIYEKAQLI